MVPSVNSARLVGPCCEDYLIIVQIAGQCHVDPSRWTTGGGVEDVACNLVPVHIFPERSSLADYEKISAKMLAPVMVQF